MSDVQIDFLLSPMIFNHINFCVDILYKSMSFYQKEKAYFSGKWFYY